ncbi:MAG TPA: aminoacyl-tRNA hydrolase, partial [Acidimicrobiia bacterium]|nr:aminoacyl-tRNA hydrolase [Acidimicrobiia bacterium]
MGSRHNVGAEIVDHLAGGHDIRWRRGPVRIPAELAEGRLGRKRVVLAKPIRFMNESGEAVRALVDYFKSDRLLVVHDDIDLALGRLRLQVGGGGG